MSLSSVVHLGSRDHERWSIQHEVLAVTDVEVSQREALKMRLSGRDVLAWCPAYWHELPESCRRGSRAICFFHHTEQWVLRDPSIVAGVCMNSTMQQELRLICPDKPVYLARVGGAETAREHARRGHPTEKIRLVVTGSGSAALSTEEMRAYPEGASPLRKSPELLLSIADRLDATQYAFVFIGPNWQPYATALRERGWTVIDPGLVAHPLQYRYLGEGDIYLMLSRLEGGPLPLLETMGLGMWPICTPTGMAPDIIRHGENGFIVSPFDGGNGDQVADEVARLIRTLDRRMLRAARGPVRESVKDRTWRNFKREMEQIMRQVFSQD
jgi:glycosyltransferase involved in cell wall biosynthesis